MVSELDDVSQSSLYKSPSGYGNVDCFVNEISKLENKMALYFKKTKKDINMTEEDQKYFEDNDVCRFCEKEIFLIK